MEASTAVSSRLIGAFFVEKGLVTQEQLDLALQKQQESGERLGEIIVADYGVSRLELASVLAEQWAELERDSKAREEQAAPTAPESTAPFTAEPLGPPVEPQLRRPIGEIFLERGFVTSDDLDKALDVQRETGKRLGEVLVEQGSLSRLDLASALAEQWSTLQKLRPPDPVEPQPWQNGAPVTVATPAEVPAELRRSVEELAERVRAVEHAAAATPWNEDLRLLGENVRAAIATVEDRVTRAATQVDPSYVDALGAAVDELRERLQEPGARLEAVERRLGELPSVEALEQRLEARLAELREALDRRPAAAGPTEELTGLRERLDELATRMVAPEQLDELRAELASLVSAPSSADDVAALRAAVEELSARAVSASDLGALQARLDEMALRVVVPEALAEVRAEVAALSREESPSEELGALRAALEELAARTVSSEDFASLRASVDALAAGAAPADHLAALQARVEHLASLTVAPEALADVRAELATVAARPGIAPEAIDELRDRVAALADRVANAPTVEPELAQQIAAVAGAADAARAEVASLTTRVEELATLRPRVDELAQRQPGAEVEELRRALAELAAQVAAARPHEEHDAQLRDLSARVEELGTRIAGIDTRNHEPSGPRLREILDGLHNEIGSLAQRPVVDVDALEGRLGALEQRGPDPAVASLAASFEEQRLRIDSRLDELASRMVDPAAVDELRARVGEATDLIAAAADAESVEQRLAGLEQRLAESTPVTELRAELGRIAESTAGERASLEQTLHARVEELAAATPSTGEVAELRTRLEELAARPAVDDGLRARVEDLSARLEQALAVAGSHEELRRAVAELRATHADAANAVPERLASVESALAALEGVEWRLQTHLEESLAVRAGELEHRLDEAMRHLHALDALEERIEALKVDLDAHPGTGALDEIAGGLRAEITRVAADLHARADAAEEAGRREATDALAGVHGSIAQHAATVAAELEAIRRESTEREQALAERLAGFAERGAVEHLREQLADHDRQLADNGLRDELGSLAGQLHERTEALRHDLDGRAADFHERLAAQAGELAALRSQLEELQAGTGHEEWRASVESGLDGRIAELEQRVASEASETRARLEQTEQTLGGSVGSLGARLEELLGLRHHDLEAARGASDALTARIDELHALRSGDAEAARAAAGELASQMEGLASSLRVESAAASAAAEQVARRLDELAALRSDDVEAARVVGVELVARLDDLAIRTATAAADADSALRQDLYALAATVEEKEAAGIEAREDLRLELERAASSIGWRLERIEETLASGDGERMRTALAELESRLEQQAALQAEQVRVTERALRKGLAGLGERLADTQTAYLDAGNTLRRSIERLGAAVIEADARMADQIPVSEVEGYVAFAPTSEGYRLVQVPGKLPELGAAVEIEGIEGQLVVTRFGRSPLPLDSRPCAYLDRA